VSDTKVPSETDEHVKVLVTKLALTGQPISVQVCPETGAVRADCFSNVERKVQQGIRLIIGIESQTI
jgi:hypothetical protein